MNISRTCTVFFVFVALLTLSSCGSNPDENEEIDLVDQIIASENVSAPNVDVQELLSESKSDDLAAFLGKEAEFQAVYVVESNNPEELDSAIVTYYYKDVNHVRKDIVTGTSEVQMVRRNSVEEACYKIAGDWACDDRSMTPMLFEIIADDIEASPASYNITLTAPRTVGEDVASCFLLNNMDITGEFCVMQTGVVSYAHIVQGEFKSVYQATTLAYEAPDEAFYIGIS